MALVFFIQFQFKLFRNLLYVKYRPEGKCPAVVREAPDIIQRKRRAIRFRNERSAARGILLTRTEIPI